MKKGFDQLNSTTSIMHVVQCLYKEINFLTVMLCPSASSLDLGGVISYAPHSVIKVATPNFSLSSFRILTVSCSRPSHK